MLYAARRSPVLTARRRACELAEDRALFSPAYRLGRLAHIEHRPSVTTPGRCSKQLPGFDSSMPPLTCSLRHGHRGMHHDGVTGADWTRSRRCWGWREEFFSAKGRLLCRMGFHNVTCRGRRDHPKRFAEHSNAFTNWPPPPRRSA
jgi:hypothetical protein